MPGPEERGILQAGTELARTNSPLSVCLFLSPPRPPSIQPHAPSTSCLRRRQNALCAFKERAVREGGHLQTRQCYVRGHGTGTQEAPLPGGSSVWESRMIRLFQTEARRGDPPAEALAGPRALVRRELRDILNKQVWQQEAQEVAAWGGRGQGPATRRARQGIGPSQSGENSGPGSTGKRRQRHPRGRVGNNTAQWPVQT